jgi:hypothetical protein
LTVVTLGERIFVVAKKDRSDEVYDPNRWRKQNLAVGDEHWNEDRTAWWSDSLGWVPREQMIADGNYVKRRYDRKEEHSMMVMGCVREYHDWSIYELDCDGRAKYFVGPKSRWRRGDLISNTDMEYRALTADECDTWIENFRNGKWAFRVNGPPRGYARR